MIHEDKVAYNYAMERLGNDDYPVYSDEYELKRAFKAGVKHADAHPDIDVRTMAAWKSGYKEAIERACEWLKEEYPKAAAYYEHPDSFIDDFKKAMKGD